MKKFLIVNLKCIALIAIAFIVTVAIDELTGRTPDKANFVSAIASIALYRTLRSDNQ